MNLQIENQQFIVCGASSGFGRAIAECLLNEKAHVIAVARREEKLKELEKEFGDAVTSVDSDLFNDETHHKIEEIAKNNTVHGLVINAGGPPAGSPLETSITDWDEAYRSVMRWKINLALRIAPYFTKNNYGRMLFIESQSVKQPLPNLVLSNAFRTGVVSFAKSLSIEIAAQKVTVNVLAPGSHNTPAINRVIEKRAEETGQSFEETKAEMEASVPVGRFGEAEEIASLAAWLLSPHSSYVTGETICHGGGSIKGIFG
jgi:3-oxoacyl-[acyl-carrier protein] reductase